MKHVWRNFLAKVWQSIEPGIGTGSGLGFVLTLVLGYGWQIIALAMLGLTLLRFNPLDLKEDWIPGLAAGIVLGTIILWATSALGNLLHI